MLENVPHNAEASCEEIFGPVTLLEPFDDFDQALATVNDSHYGLQAGVFTRDIVKIQKAWDEPQRRRRADQRDPVLAGRSNALRRQQGQWPRPRRRPLGDREHDRGPAARDSHAAVATGCLRRDLGGERSQLSRDIQTARTALDLLVERALDHYDFMTPDRAIFSNHSEILMLTTVCKRWWVLMVRGIAAIALGICAIVWPGITLV